MNERMLELLVQSGLLINVSEYRVNELDPNIKKFAELIVKECANLNFRGTGFVTSEGEDMVRSMIKQHFGFKE